MGDGPYARIVVRIRAILCIIYSLCGSVGSYIQRSTAGAIIPVSACVQWELVPRASRGTGD